MPERSDLSGQNILLGITGGIAAYKTPMLVRQLVEAGANIQVVMSENAHRFVTSTTLQAVSGNPVRDDLWDPAAEAAMGHIELARWADQILIAPATANAIARLAAGDASNLLYTPMSGEHCTHQPCAGHEPADVSTSGRAAKSCHANRGWLSRDWPRQR